MSSQTFISLMKSIAVSSTLLCYNPAVAGPYADTLGKKLVSSTTASDKILLVRWMFSSMSLHPELKDLSTITHQQRTEINQAVGKMVTRLLTQTCLAETREAVRYEGPTAISEAFQLFGQVAAMEIFGNPKVAEGLSELNNAIDPEIFKKALEHDPKIN